MVLGGQGNKLGVIFGAFMIVYLPNRLLGVHLFGVNLGDLKYLFFGLALVLLMIFRPQGLFPVRQQLLAYGDGPAICCVAPMTRRRRHDVGATGPRIVRSSTRSWPRCIARCMPPRAKPCSETKDLTVKFGGLTALDAVSFDIKRGEILGLIGPNGAGKTTCFNAITGVYRPSAGSVTFDGEPLGRIKRHQITRLGIARTFQNIRLWGEMTALENVVVATDARHRTSVPGRGVPHAAAPSGGTFSDREGNGAVAIRRDRASR